MVICKNISTSDLFVKDDVNSRGEVKAKLTQVDGEREVGQKS